MTVRRIALRQVAIGLVTAAIICLFPVSVQAQTTSVISGNLKTILGENLGSRTFIQFRLRHSDGSFPVAPRVVGVGTIVQTTKRVKPDSNGLISTTLYRNDAIEPAGTFWVFEYHFNGRFQFSQNFNITTATLDFNTATPIVVTASTALIDSIIRQDHTQFFTSQTVWTITHNFNSTNVTCHFFDAVGGDLFYPGSSIPTDVNTWTGTFVTAESGKATCSSNGLFSFTNELTQVLNLNPSGSQTGGNGQTFTWDGVIGAEDNTDTLGTSANLWGALYTELVETGVWNDFRIVDGNRFTTADLALTNCGAVNECRLIIPTSYAGANPTSTTLTENQAIFDLRANKDRYSVLAREATVAPFQFYNLKTTDLGGGGTDHHSALIVDFHRLTGGTNGGTKTTDHGVRFTQQIQGRGQTIGISGILFKPGGGDGVGVIYESNHFGQCITAGDECAIAFKGEVKQGSNNTSLFTATIDSVVDNGATRTITYSSPSNEHLRGLDRWLINTAAAKIYTTGSVTGISGTPPVVTFTGTTLVTQFGSGAHTDLCFSQDDDDNASLKFVIPVSTIDTETQLTLAYTVGGSNGGWTGDSDGSNYRIHKCGQVTDMAHTLTITVTEGATDWAATDTVELPFGYAFYGVGLRLSTNIRLPVSSSHGFSAIDIGHSGTRATNAIQISGPFFNGIAFATGADIASSHIDSIRTSGTFTKFSQELTGNLALFNWTDDAAIHTALYNETSNELQWTRAGQTGIAMILDVGDFRARRVKTAGVTLVAGDIDITHASWGTGETVTGIRGSDQWFEFVVNSGTSAGASPDIVVTFTDGTWSTAPIVLCNRQEFAVNPTFTISVTTVTATAITLTFDGTPTDSSAFRFACHVGGI